MNFETIEHFDRQVKKLAKRYRNIKKDLQSFIKNFDSIHQQATSIQKNLYKIRLANSNKTEVKARVIEYIIMCNSKRLLIL